MKSILSSKLPLLILFLLFSLVIPKSPSFHPYQWKLITVQDSEEFPPYQTNGQGPLYHEDENRFQEISQKEPPHPEMPDEEPHALAEMEEKYANMLGVPHYDGKRKRTEPFNASLEQMQAKLMNPRLIEQDFRFAQISTDSSLSEKDRTTILSTNGNSNNEWDTVQIAKAWASSVYTYRYWWYYHTYPASNAITGWSYWCSTGGHSKDQVVTWQGDFDRVRRIANLWIRWAYAPGSLSVQTTSDEGKTWEERTPWRNAANSNAAKVSSAMFWWWQYNYRSYAESVIFDEPIFATGVRILMKDPVFYYFGIYQVKVVTKKWLVQLKSGQNTDSDECLNLNNGVASYGQEITVRNCIEAIEQGDARELFILQNNMQITSYNENFCIESSDGVIEETSHIHLQNCRLIISSTNDGREKWLLDTKGFMKIYKNTNKCLTIKGNEIELQTLSSTVASVSSVMNDGQHEGNQGISSAEDSYWASMPGSETAEYKLIFPGATVKEIVIKWKYIAAQYEVSCYMNGYWRSFASKKDNEDQEVKINIGSKFISGIRVLMLKAADDAKFNDKVIYGISSLKVKTGSKAVHLKDCENEGASQLNKWFVDDANFVDIATAPKLIYEFQKLYETSNRLLDLVHKVMLWPPKIQMMVEKAKLLATEIAKIDSEIGSIDLKLQQFKAQNLAEESSGKKDSGLGSLGSSSMRPASSCAYIKQLFPYKMTGYYWIQPDCAKVPIRVFCDYSNSETGIDYVYYGGLGDSVIKNKIKSLNDVKYYCSKLGLYPVELKNKVQILLIQHYLTDIGVNLQSKGFIPMAMDYGCEKQACTGRFSSLSSRTSQDVTEPLTGMIDTQNLLTQDFSKQLNEKPNDLIGFGLSKTGTMTAKFQGGKIPIKGILCSTNNEKGDNTNNWIKADCNTKPRGDNNFDGEINTNIKVICPTGCLSTGSGKVVGTEVFTDDSSVCKAAIHNGALSAEKGGKIEIGILEGKNKYVGSQSFGIKSENLDEKWDRSFVTNQYKVICPIEDFKNRKVTSFLEIIDQNIPINKNLSYLKRKNNRIMNDKDTAFLKIKSAFKTKNTTSFLELYNEIEDEGFPIKNSVTSALNKAKNKASSALSSAQTASSKASETVSNAVSKATDNADATSETASTITSDAAASTTTSESEAGSNSNESQTQKVSSSTNEEIKTGSKLDSTEDAVEKLISLFDLDKDDLTKQVRLIKDTTELLNGLQKEYGPLVNSNLSPDSQSQYTDSLAQHLKGTNIEMGKILSEASSKLKHKQDFKTKLRLEKLKYLKYEPYIEKYDLKLEDIYEIHDFVQASNKPSKWSFSKSALNGHATAIAQTSDIQINGDLKERFASLLKLKYKDFFDGRLTVSLLAKDTGRIGIAFRYLDQFNFYVFEMEKSSSGNTGFKRLRKFVNGEPTVLAIENDGGYLQDKWYRIVIDFSMSKFVVRMEEESEKNLKPDFEDQMTKVIEGYDGDFAEGGFAFLVNSMAGVYFDLFEVKAGKCIDQEKNQDLNIYLPHSCSRFKESFYTDLSFLWKAIDPKNSKNGPSSWQFDKDIFGRNHAIVQSSLISGADSSKTPAILQFKLDKICHEGLIQVDFYSETNEGYLGIGFHYENSNNHYVFEMTGTEKDRFCQVRKVMDGVYKSIQKTEDNKCGFEINKWHSFTVKITSKQWIFYLSKENEGLAEVLKMDADEELQKGFIALMTYETKAAFSNIKTMPLEDFQFKETGVEVVSVEQINNDENKGSEDGGQNQSNESPKTKKNKEKAAEYEGCLEKKTPEEREKYCKAKFEDDKTAQTDCKGNFCDRCCEDNIDSIHVLKRFKCKKNCKGLTQTDQKSEEWQFCVSSPRPTLSIYQYCEANESNEFEKSRCKMDFCNLCCTISDGVFKKKFGDDLVEKCHKQCLENFSEIKDITVPLNI